MNDNSYGNNIVIKDPYRDIIDNLSSIRTNIGTDISLQEHDLKLDHGLTNFKLINISHSNKSIFNARLLVNNEEINLPLYFFEYNYSKEDEDYLYVIAHNVIDCNKASRNYLTLQWGACAKAEIFKKEKHNLLEQRLNEFNNNIVRNVEILSNEIIKGGIALKNPYRRYYYALKRIIDKLDHHNLAYQMYQFPSFPGHLNVSSVDSIYQNMYALNILHKGNDYKLYSTISDDKINDVKDMLTLPTNLVKMKEEEIKKSLSQKELFKWSIHEKSSDWYGQWRDYYYSILNNFEKENEQLIQERENQNRIRINKINEVEKKKRLKPYQDIIDHLSIGNDTFINNESIVTNVNSQLNNIGIIDKDINVFISKNVAQFESFNVDHVCWQKAVILEVLKNKSTKINKCVLTENLILNYEIDIGKKYREMLMYEDHVLDCLPLGTYLPSNDEVIDQYLVHLEKDAMFFSFLNFENPFDN